MVVRVVFRRNAEALTLCRNMVVRPPRFAVVANSSGAEPPPLCGFVLLISGNKVCTQFITYLILVVWASPLLLEFRNSVVLID